jgi:hypothetical protein
MTAGHGATSLLRCENLILRVQSEIKAALRCASIGGQLFGMTGNSANSGNSGSV